MRIPLAVVLLLLLLPAAQAGEEGPSKGALIWARETVAERLADPIPAAEFPAEREWLNVREPLSLEGKLAGKVVLLDFWCYCCINCMHVLPDLEYLEETYAARGLAVVGVHSAKFENEKDAGAIREAIRRYEIHHPVVNDADFAIWRAYGARAWPTFALIAPDGTLIGRLSGEGRREELEALIVALLERFEGRLDTTPLPLRLERDTRAPGALAYPGGVAYDPESLHGFVADSNHNRIVELDHQGRFVRTFGSGERGLLDGPAKEARFFRPQGLRVFAGALWVCDTNNHAIRRIDLETGVVETVAGTGAQGNHWRAVRLDASKDPDAKPGAGWRRGPWPGRETALSSPWDIEFVDGTGYIAMAGSHSLWTIDPKTKQVAHFAGDFSERRLDGATPFEVAFAQPSSLTSDGEQLYVADSESSSIVRVGLDGSAHTLAGASEDPRDLFHFGDEDGPGRGRRFQHPLAVLFHDGLLYVADSYNHKIKTVDPKTGEVKSLLGTGRPGFSNERGKVSFSEPAGLIAHEGVLVIVDTNNHALRGVILDDLTVQTAPLKDVPVPRVHARGGVGAEWPTLPGTVFEAPRSVRLAADPTAAAMIQLDLPEGWKLTEGAPSMARIEIDDTVTDVRLLSLLTPVQLPTFEAGTQKGRLRLLYYVCQDDGECRVRSVDVPLEVEVARGAAPPMLLDRFLP